jgi:uncharacterized protein YkwD
MILQRAYPLLGRNLCALSKNFARTMNILVLALVAFCANAGAQAVDPRVSRLLEVKAVESTFSRPRRIDVPVIPTAETATASPFSFQDATSFERTAFELTNEARVASGLRPLQWDAELCRLARAHSEDMARRAFFDHETPEGLRPKERARAFGVYGFRVIAENIAYNKGYDDPAALAVNRWLSSSGHRANILYNRFQYSAIGSYVSSDGSVYLTQVFISR